VLVLIAVLLGIVALVAGYGAYLYASFALAFASLACVLAATAVLLLDRSRRTQTRRAPAPAQASPERPSPSPVAEPSESVAPERAERRMAAGTTEPLIVLPQDIDAPSVAQAFLTAAGATGHAVRVTVWRGDGAGDSAAVPVATAGVHDDALVQARDSVCSSIEQGTALLESLTVSDGEHTGQTAWRYIVPFTLGEITGAAGVDFLGDRPALELLNRTAAAYRLPLAAALALEIARDASDAAQTLIATARELARLLDPDAIVHAALSRAIELTEARTGSIMLYDKDGVDLVIAAAQGLPDEVVESTSVRPGNGIAGWVALSGQPLVVEDLPGRESPARARGTRSAISMPIADSEGVLGVLNIGSTEHPSRFTATELATLEALAHQTAVALRNAREMAAAGDLYFDTLRALALAIESRDPYAHGGTDRVMGYATLIAKEMDVGPEVSRPLEIAAMLHDIGMPPGCEEALSAPRPLSTVERGLIAMHPVIAAEILKQGPALREVAPIVYHHHERYDGTGYPDGLAGDDIPLGARILAVADAYVAMTSERPYRSALSPDEAVRELLKGSGTQFDPEVVDAMLAIRTSQSNQAPGVRT